MITQLHETTITYPNHLEQAFLRSKYRLFQDIEWLDDPDQPIMKEIQRNISFFKFIGRNIHIFMIFFLTIAVRSGIMFAAYRGMDVDLFFKTNIDFLNHTRFVQDILNGNFFHHEFINASVFYSPITPMVVSIFVYPISYLSSEMTLIDAVIIASSILMGIKALGTYWLLREYKMNRWISAVLVIFNPWEVAGVLPWGGLSLMLSSTCVIYALLIYRKMKDNRISDNKGIAMIAFLLLISASAHRTGIVVQISTLMVYLGLQIWTRRRNIIAYVQHTSKKSLLASVFLLFAPLTYLYFSRVHYSIENTVYYAPGYYANKVDFFVGSLVEGLPLVIVTVVGVLLYARFKQQDISLLKLEKAYLLMAIFFQFIPFVNHNINARFYLAIDGLLLFFWAFTEYAIRKHQKLAKRKKISLLVTYWIVTLAICIGSITIAIIQIKDFITPQLPQFLW